MTDRAKMDYYHLLGLQPTASQKEIRDAYRCQVSNCHPDKFQDADQKELAEERIKRINEAYETLRDVSLRNSYDQRYGHMNAHQTSSTSSKRHPSYQTVSYKQTWVDPYPYHPFYRDSHIPPVSPLETVYPTFINQRTQNSFPTVYVFLANQNDRLQVFLNLSAMLILLDELNYLRYQSNRDFEYLGGKALFSPTFLHIPFSDRWHLVIEPFYKMDILRTKVILISAKR